MNTVPWSIWVGFDPREAGTFAVCRASIQARLIDPIPTYGVVLDELRAEGLYTRPTERREGKLWDVISEAPMATEFAISRFLVPHLARRDRKAGEAAGWALFMDCDMLVLENLSRVFEQADPRRAVMCVKHRHAPPPGRKMDGQEQLQYARKNWTSFMLLNCDHPANAALTVELVNGVPGRDLHRFCWLPDDDLIGELSPEWNWLVGHNTPKVVHFTEGTPDMPGYEGCEFADAWRAERTKWARGHPR
jgi:hypothetical protein